MLEAKFVGDKFWMLVKSDSSILLSMILVTDTKLGRNVINTLKKVTNILLCHQHNASVVHFYLKTST